MEVDVSRLVTKARAASAPMARPSSTLATTPRRSGRRPPAPHSRPSRPQAGDRSRSSGAPTGASSAPVGPLRFGLWSVADNAMLADWEAPSPEQPNGIATSADGTRLAGEVTLWTIDGSRGPRFPFPGSPRLVDYARSGNRVVIAGPRRTSTGRRGKGRWRRSTHLSRRLVAARHRPRGHSARAQRRGAWEARSCGRLMRPTSRRAPAGHSPSSTTRSGTRLVRIGRPLTSR